MSTRNLLLAAAVTGALLGALQGSARAQSATAGAVQGVVSDKATGEAMAGVTVVVTSSALQGTQSAISEGNGFYKITNLPPGMYVVTFYFGEIVTKRTDVVVNANKTTPVFVKIDTTQTGGEVIEIKGTANIDTTSTTQGITLDRNYTKNIPVPGRTFEDALGAAAGSAGDELGVSFSGSTSLENQYIVDGINTTGLTFGNVGTPVINEFIEEIEIITGGYQAEFGRATGGVVNVVTKSGSNEFHGSVFTSVTSDYLAKDRTRNPSEATSIDATAQTRYNANLGFELGGPIVKDRLWFFVGFSPTIVDTEIDRYTKRRTDCRSLLPSGELSPCDPSNPDNVNGIPDEDEDGFLIYEDIRGGHRSFNQRAQQYQLVSKVSYAPAPEHQGQVTVSGLSTNAERLGVLGEPGATSVDQKAMTSDVGAKWTSKFFDNKTEVEAVIGWHRDRLEVNSIDDSVNGQPLQILRFGRLSEWGQRGYESMATVLACADGGDDPFPNIENCPDAGAGYRIGGPGFLANDLEQRYSGRLSATQRVKALGDHEIKLGGDVEQNLLNKPRSFSGNAFYDVWIGNTESDDEATGRGFPRQQTEVHRWVGIAPRTDGDPRFSEDCGPDPYGGPNDRLRCEFLGPTDVEGNTLNWSAYLRDSWQILPNLTFNAGLRYEEQYLRHADHLQNEVDPFTLEPRGKNAMEMRNMWAPRLGALYDWSKEGRSKVYANYGRFYESIPMDINDRSFGGETLLNQTFSHGSTDDQGNPVCGNIDPTIGAPPGPGCQGDPNSLDLFGGNGVLVAPGIRPQYLDEFVIGAEYEVIEDLKVGVSLQRRVMGRVIEDVSTDDARTYLLANPGEFSTEEERALENEITDLMASGEPADASLAVRKQAQLDQFRGIRIFDKPKRDYNALQLTMQKRFSQSFFMQGSYTYSRIIGNYPGLFSSDNGQVDPNISSQYDLIELLANREGPLPQDRPHYFKLDGYYTFDFEKQGALTTGGRVRALSGVAHEALARHVTYGVDESFLLPRGEMGRLDWDYTLDAHVGYTRAIGRGMAVEVYADVFNLPTLIKSEGVFSVDESYTFDAANPVVGGDYEDLVFVKAQDTDGSETSSPVLRNRNFNNPAARYTPFFAQLGARLTF
jgi:hypothetical protein